MVQRAHIGPRIDHCAPVEAGGRHYAVCMAVLAPDLVEFLQRTRDGLPTWGGSVAIARLLRESACL